jgi:membrane fusion protein (multidrug efflux system)
MPKPRKTSDQEDVVMKRFIKPASWLVAGVVALLVASAVAARSRAPAVPAAPPAPEVTVVTVAPETVSARYEYVGQAEASRSVEVRALVTGVIVARPYVEGTDVVAGTLLFRVDPTMYEATYRSAEARLANAQRTLARLTPLLAARAVAQKDVDDAQTAVDQAQATFDRARKDYDDTFVRAGIAGRAGRALLQLGARVTGPGDLLTTVEQVDPIYLNFSPSDGDVLRWRSDIAAGRLVVPQGPQTVQITLADGSVNPRTGTLNFTDLALQPVTGTQELRAELRNPQHLLLPGQFVRVRLLGWKRPGAFLVPQRAVQQGLGGAFVYVVEAGDKVATRDVMATSWDGGSWLIEQGLAAGDRVVVDGVQQLAPGSTVRAVAYQPAADSAGARSAQ